MDGKLTGPQGIYDQLWNKATAALETGGWQVDPLIHGTGDDPRRALTLVARPDPVVQARIEIFLREAAAICPGQHFYQPAELHVTVLAIIPGSAAWRGEIYQVPVCQAALGEVLKTGRAFSLKFRGVTASPEAVLVQGFPQDDSLALLRDRLRSALRDREAGEKLDRRYKISAAHLTVMRFSNPKADWRRLLDFLRAHRETDFGETRFQSLQLIWSDWCASTRITRTLREYALKN